MMNFMDLQYAQSVSKPHRHAALDISPRLLGTGRLGIQLQSPSFDSTPVREGCPSFRNRWSRGAKGYRLFKVVSTTVLGEMSG